MDYMVRATSAKGTNTEVRGCATRTDVENFIVEKLRACFETGEDVLFYVTKETS